MLKVVPGTPDFALAVTPSRTMAALLLAVHAALLAVVFSFPLNKSVVAVAVALVLLHMALAGWRHNSTRNARWVAHLECVNGRLAVADRRGWHAVTLVNATVWRSLMILNLRRVGRRDRLQLVLFNDSCSARAWREVSVLLRHCVSEDGD